MSYRLFVSQGILAAATAALMLAPGPVAAQSSAAPAAKAPAADKDTKAYNPPRTPWGDPNIQGVWPSTNMIGTPMQRDAKLGTRNVLNDQELAVRQRTRQAEDDFDDSLYVSDKTRCDPSNPAARIPGVGGPGGQEGEVYKTCGSNGVTIGPPLYWDERGTPNRQASLIVDPENGRMPAMTPAAQKAAQERQAIARKNILNRGGVDTWEDRSLTERCITWGPGLLLPSGYDSGNQIIQGPGYVAITVEKVHETRVIPLDGRPHAGSNFQGWLGDARGHWEGNTLVVETTNFRAGQQVGGQPTSDALKLEERFTLTGPGEMRYVLTVDDPKTWTRPWTVAFPLKRDANYKVYEYACHEANYSMYNLLSGARAEEAAGKVPGTK